MSALSDTTIRRLIGEGRLIEGGSPAHANNCTYEFKAARVVYGGHEEGSNHVTTVDVSNGSKTALVSPSAVVWVQSKERVKIPPNMVGIWIQTNSLSRRGLLLLNTTLVEPGYEGHLSAHFVNLGSSAVSLSSHKTIAKLLFLELDQAATELVDGRAFEDYDSLINDLAVQSHKSFLRISELVPDLETATVGAVSRAKDQISGYTKTTIEGAKQELLNLKKETFFKVGGGFVAGIVLAVAFSLWIFPRLRNIDAESARRIEAIVESQTATLQEALDELRGEVSTLRSQDAKNESHAGNVGE